MQGLVELAVNEWLARQLKCRSAAMNSAAAT